LFMGPLLESDNRMRVSLRLGLPVIGALGLPNFAEPPRLPR
jgi:hypothetical protein